ncbi:hypothetical protein F442_11663 [Phytophthora nicotianae P10297]|uniref:Uncharacterized protein n=1 Tax=Phytophthora nicotianae P10297 TaxID=1317064 RepID=W2Z1F3_PHYNI|nr:hypothetical protein F442_11663 [Phytophthora nicotianae P10297]
MERSTTSTSTNARSCRVRFAYVHVEGDGPRMATAAAGGDTYFLYRQLVSRRMVAPMVDIQGLTSIWHHISTRTPLPTNTAEP